jgi:hypothetical protein
MAAHEERRITDGIKRRSVLRGGLLVGVGLATAGVASAALTETAKAASPQPNWAYCKYCNGMWYTANGSAWCPAFGHRRGAHSSSTSYNYELFNSSSGGGGSSGYQGNWAWCSQCAGLFTTLHPGNSSCPGFGTSTTDAGPHTSVGSWQYFLWINPVSGNNPQPGWRWCGNCDGLYFQGSSGTEAGVCPYGYPNNGKHVEGPGSDQYSVDWYGTF